MKKLAFIFLVLVIGICFTVSAFAGDFYVISVQNKCSPCKGTSSSGGRWCDNGDGTVTDMTTCLVWLKYASWGGIKLWIDWASFDGAHTRAGILKAGETIYGSGETAVKLADGSVEGDWRLPTKTELVGITQGGETVSYSNMQLFNGVTPPPYWSSTTRAMFPQLAYCVNMVTGGVIEVDKAYPEYPILVWPVRGGN